MIKFNSDFMIVFAIILTTSFLSLYMMIVVFIPNVYAAADILKVKQKKEKGMAK